jgi:hypothetical protein
MSDDISSVPLTRLVNACNEQTEHFKHNKPFDARYCLEIFRRGIVTHDDAAWEALYAIYTTVVKNWLLRSARTLVELARQHSDTAVDDAIQDGFVQFYLQFSSQKLRFADWIMSRQSAEQVCSGFEMTYSGSNARRLDMSRISTIR